MQDPKLQNLDLMDLDFLRRERLVDLPDELIGQLLHLG